MTVLVAEDERISRLYLTRALQRGGYRVVEVESGERVLSAVEEERIDLLLLDYSLPERSGLEIAGELQRSEKHGTIPVVLITGYDLEEFGGERLPESIREVLVKPVQQEKLLQLLAELFR
jgi:CheY-like chemotaxis protein